MPNYLTKNLL